MALTGELPRLDSPDGLHIEVREQGTTIAIEMAGEWDLAGQDAARRAIARVLAGAPECMVLDLTRLEFIDSRGLHVAIELAQRCAAQNVRFVIIPGPPAVHRLFQITGIADRLPFIDEQPTKSRASSSPSARNGKTGPGRVSLPPPAPAAAPPRAAGAGTVQSRAAGISPTPRRKGRKLHRDRNHLSAVLREFANRKTAAG